MESIVLNTQTGFIMMGSYAIHPHLTFTEIKSQKGVKSRESEANITGRISAYAYLPHFGFLGYQIETRLAFYYYKFSDDFISGGGFHWMTNMISDDTKPLMGPQATVIWTRHIKQWLMREFGSPHEISPPILLDEDQWYTKEELSHLDYWTYRYPWGEFEYTYHWQTGASVHFGFDQHYQVGDWDGLRATCLRYADSVKSLDVLRNYSLIKVAIDTIATQYDYMTVRVSVPQNLRMLVFDLRHWSTKVIIDIRPNRPDRPYHISRFDSVKKVSTTAERLMDDLRIFLETENL